jgi:hypothetical protein
MLAIRDEQLEAFARVREEAFEARMQSHLRRYFPAACAAMPDVFFPLFVRAGIAAAREWSLTSERHVCKFLNLAIVFGVRFFEQPHLAWMRAALLDPALPDPGDRLDHLYQQTIHRLRREERERSLRDRFARGE